MGYSELFLASKEKSGYWQGAFSPRHSWILRDDAVDMNNSWGVKLKWGAVSFYLDSSWSFLYYFIFKLIDLIT